MEYKTITEAKKAREIALSVGYEALNKYLEKIDEKIMKAALEGEGSVNYSIHKRDITEYHLKFLAKKLNDMGYKTEENFRLASSEYIITITWGE